MFNLKQELKTIKLELLTWQQMFHELNEVAWRCRRDLPPEANGKMLFEIAYEKGLIKQAFPSDQYGIYFVVVT